MVKEDCGRKRKMKFQVLELEVLVEEVKKHTHTLQQSNLNISRRNAIWEAICEKVNAVGKTRRTTDEVKRRWQDMRRRAKESVYVKKTCGKKAEEKVMVAVTTDELQQFVCKEENSSEILGYDTLKIEPAEQAVSLEVPQSPPHCSIQPTPASPPHFSIQPIPASPPQFSFQPTPASPQQSSTQPTPSSPPHSSIQLMREALLQSSIRPTPSGPPQSSTQPMRAGPSHSSTPPTRAGPPHSSTQPTPAESKGRPSVDELDLELLEQQKRQTTALEEGLQSIAHEVRAASAVSRALRRNSQAIVAHTRQLVGAVSGLTTAINALVRVVENGVRAVGASVSPSADSTMQTGNGEEHTLQLACAQQSNPRKRKMPETL